MTGPTVAGKQPDMLTLLDCPLPDGVERTVDIIAAGGASRCDEGRWLDALAVLEQGCIRIETKAGNELRLACGAVFCLAHLGPITIHNVGTDPAVISTVRHTEVGSIRGPANQPERKLTMDMKLELVPMPVTDIDRAKAFYLDKVGFHEDVDVQPAEGVRVVQLTPAGSACSIVLSTGLPALAEMTPGTIKGLHLVVADIAEARNELVDRGVDVAAIDDSAGGGVRYAWFSDPDGNTLVLQEMSWRTGDAF